MPLNAAQLSETAFVLHQVLTFEQPSDVLLSAHFREQPHLGQQDRAFIAETVYGVIRRLRSLHVICEKPGEALLPRQLVLAWLARFGGFNLREFEPVTDKHEFEWLKTVKSFDLAAQPEAVRLDLPDWLYTRLDAQIGEALPRLAESLNRPAPLDLRVNTARMSREAVLTNLLADGFAAEPTPLSPLGLRLKGKPALNRNALFKEGVIEVQDEGSQLLALLTGAKRGEMVCDFCAGAGGKTLALGDMMRNSGRLYAFDVAEKRLANLKPRLARSGLSNVHPQLIAHENDSKLKRLSGKFDRVLVDAPCSGLGTLRRNPDLKWRQTPESVAELQEKQARILASAARLVRPGGRLVYATCSVLKAENADQVEAFLAAHADFEVIPATEALARQNVTLETGAYMQLTPAEHNTDGFFAAVLQRKA